MTTNKFSIQTGFLDLKEGVAGGNTPPKVYLVALERLCGIFTITAAFVAKVPTYRKTTTTCQKRGTPPIAEILWVKNGRVIVICGFLVK